jgi:hypothetical protein
LLIINHYVEKSGICTVRSAYKTLVTVNRAREDWLDGVSASSRSSEEGLEWSLKVLEVQSTLQDTHFSMATCALLAADGGRPAPEMYGTVPSLFSMWSSRLMVTLFDRVYDV